MSCLYRISANTSKFAVAKSSSQPLANSPVTEGFQSANNEKHNRAQQIAAGGCSGFLCSRCADLKPFWVHHGLDNNVNSKLTHTKHYSDVIMDAMASHQPRDCLLNCIFKRLLRRRSKKTSMVRVTGLCAGNSPVTGEFPAQKASNAENVSIWWRHHDISSTNCWVLYLWDLLYL